MSKQNPSTKTVDDLIAMIRPYYAANAAGGNLHVSLDDGNMDGVSVWFCLREAANERDLDGVRIAVALLELSEDSRHDLYDRYSEYAA